MSADGACSSFTPRSEYDTMTCAWSHAAHQRQLFARGDTSKACASFEPLPGAYSDYCAVCHWSLKSHGGVDRTPIVPYVEVDRETCNGVTLRFSRSIRVF
jgi:hypothetical protein